MVPIEWLKETELFKGLKEGQLKAILLLSEVQSCPGGKMIFSQGEEANGLYILIDGAIDLTVKAHEKVDFMTSKIEKEGAVFGTAALMEPYQYNVSATCLKPSKVLAIEAAPLRKTMEQDPAMGMEVMKKLATIYFNRLNDLRSGVSSLLKIFKIKMP